MLQNYRSKLRRGFLSDCMSIASLEQGLIINKDGSISVGFEATLFEEEMLSADQFKSILATFGAAVQQLPIGTAVQKLDIYWESTHHVDITAESPFFQRQTLMHHDEKKVLRHQCYLFLRFFSQSSMPTNSFLALGARMAHTNLAQLEAKKETVHSAYSEFVTSMPQGLTLRKLSDKGHETLLYQYTSLTFHRNPIGFERDIVVLPDCLSMGVYLKSVAMKSQADEVTPTRKNEFGAHGVTSPFLWRLGHHAQFPHMVCQNIEIIDDKRFRNHKGLELEYSAQLKIQPRNRALAMHMQEQLWKAEKILNEQDIKIVKLHLHVFTWHTSKEQLQQQTDYIKSALGNVGIEAYEEAEDTDNTFFAHIPGGIGFLEGCHMPLESAVAHLNFSTDRKGDQTGVILQNRHGKPIFYDPFKYTLDNQHVFVFGPSGSGKSFFNGKMIKDRYYAGHTMVVIDSGGTYRFLFRALGGKYIEYDPAHPLRLNPFLVKQYAGKYLPTPDKIAFLVNFLGKIWKGNLNKNPLSEVEYALLSKFLTFYYNALKANEIPNLRGFCTWLKAHVTTIADITQDIFDARNFFIVLEPFTAGIYQEHFNASEVEYLEDSRLLCFELEAVKNDRKLYPLVVQVLFDYVLQLVAAQPSQKKFIDIEEGWTMLDDTSESYIASFFRKGRKTNTSIRIITQHVDEIKHSRIAGAMKNNAATFILLYNDKSSVRHEIAQFLGMDEFDMEKYASLRRRDNYIDGYREVFIKEMDKSSVWRIGISLFEHGILTSRPDERNEISRLTQQAGNIQQAVTAWVNSIRTTEKQQYGA